MPLQHLMLFVRMGLQARQARPEPVCYRASDHSVLRMTVGRKQGAPLLQPYKHSDAAPQLPRDTVVLLAAPAGHVAQVLAHPVRLA
jgi:hypothetical protein